MAKSSIALRKTTKYSTEIVLALNNLFTLGIKRVKIYLLG